MRPRRRPGLPVAATRGATETKAAPSPFSIPPTNWATPTGIPTSPASSVSSVMSSLATPRPGCCATLPRPPSTSRTQRSPPAAPQTPSARTGESRLLPTTAAMLLWAKTAPASAPTSACSPAYAVSPSTSSRQTAPTRSARTATAPLLQASTTFSNSSLFHSVEQPWTAIQSSTSPSPFEGEPAVPHSADGSNLEVKIGSRSSVHASPTGQYRSRNAHVV